MFIARQIGEHHWNAGEEALRSSSLSQLTVCVYTSYVTDSRWEYIVVRRGDNMERQTWCNGQLMGSSATHDCDQLHRYDGVADAG